MNSLTIERLLTINRQFYQTFAVQFSHTRQRIQPGVEKILALVGNHDRVLDLGCGNGELAARLHANGFTGEYTGLDQSPALLAAANQRLPIGLPGRFLQADLSAPGWEMVIPQAGFDWIFLFAVLHHIPGQAVRLELLKSAHRLICPGRRLALSAWQFLNSPRLADRIQPWERAGISTDDVDPGDYLLDWRAGGEGLRYVHSFDPVELTELAQTSGWQVVDTFLSDGQGGRLGLYQTWQA